MSVPPASNYHQSLHLQTDLSPDRQSITPISPSPHSSFPRSEPWGYASPSGEFYGRICSVIGLYDFFSSDHDRLSFRKHEILEIVRQDESGWWGAVRRDGTEIGWIPAKFVRALSDDAVHRVHDVRERPRIPESASGTENVRSVPPLSGQIVETLSSGTPVPDNELSDITLVNPWPSNWSDPSTVTKPAYDPITPKEPDHLRNSPPPTFEVHEHKIEEIPPHTVSLTIVPPVSQELQSLRLDKPLPASPDGTTAPNSARTQPKIRGHRRNSSDSAVDSPNCPSGSSTIWRTQTSDQLSSLVSFLDLPLSPLPCPVTPTARPRPGKVLQLTGDDSAQAFHNAKQAQAKLPWFLRHRHGEEEIKLEFDGTVKAGTLPALVEHLVVNPLRASQQEIFRRAFLVTFRSFATATEIFSLLAAQYELDAPPNLSEEEFEQWKHEKLRPTQTRVLTVLTMWLEEYDLLNQDPEVAPKLQNFLRLIVTPPALALTAKHMLKSLERLTFADPPMPETIVLTTRKWKKMRKGEVLELVRMDPLEVAQHISLLESDLYRKIRPQECFLWSKIKEGDAVKNIQSFCATHDRLANWVKCSILEVSALGKRANVVDFWIRVAEKCRSLNNFSSMSSIVAALSSVLVSRLHFTWVNASREHSVDPLRKIIHPASNYGHYRSILEAVEGPCVPFVGPFLKNIIYAQEQHADNVFVQSTTHPERHFTLIHFVKRQKWYDITLQMLRFQAKPYAISEIPEMTSFITSQIEKAATMGERWYWQRSDELQHAELVHADIRRGLEAAGF